MQNRVFGKTNQQINPIGLGTWQLGGVWGSVFNDKLAQEVLETAEASGINFIDTADVYSMGLSEKAIGSFLKNKRDKFFIASKCGRMIQPHVSEGYTPESLKTYVENSLKRLGTDYLDLIQLHCPPTEVYYRPEIFAAFEDLKKEGKIKHLGVSVEKVEEGLKAIEYDNVVSVQIIFNMFRQRPSELFFEQVKKKNVAVIARVPLASGLLAGKFTADSIFEEGDHRFFNRKGEFFDKGETFSGVPYEQGLMAVEELKSVFADTDFSLAQWALKWVLQHETVSVVIPGASNAEQVIRNMFVHNMPDFTVSKFVAVRDIYRKYFYNSIQQMW
jgi:aryl-alcohol dehydrogenase-like predicted oxidoreductase